MQCEPWMDAKSCQQGCDEIAVKFDGIQPTPAADERLSQRPFTRTNLDDMI